MESILARRWRNRPRLRLCRTPIEPAVGDDDFLAFVAGMRPMLHPAGRLVLLPGGKRAWVHPQEPEWVDGDPWPGGDAGQWSK